MGYRDWEPAEESWAGITAGRKGSELSISLYVLWGLAWRKQKTPAWELKVSSKGQGLMLDPSELLLRQPHHHNLHSFLILTLNVFLLICLDLSSVYLNPYG